jgi:hypothetical protein
MTNHDNFDIKILDLRNLKKKNRVFCKTFLNFFGIQYFYKFLTDMIYHDNIFFVFKLRILRF